MNKVDPQIGNTRKSNNRLLEMTRNALQSEYMTLPAFILIITITVLVIQVGCGNSIPYYTTAGLLIAFVCLASLIYYAESKLKYARLTESYLKKELRTKVVELAEERNGLTLWNPLELVHIIDNCFSVDELSFLCMEIDTKYAVRATNPHLDYDNLNGNTKIAKILDLVKYCQRRGLLAELAATVHKHRPDISISS